MVLDLVAFHPPIGLIIQAATTAVAVAREVGHFFARIRSFNDEVESTVSLLNDKIVTLSSISNKLNQLSCSIVNRNDSSRVSRELETVNSSLKDLMKERTRWLGALRYRNLNNYAGQVDHNEVYRVFGPIAQFCRDIDSPEARQLGYSLTEID